MLNKTLDEMISNSVIPSVVITTAPLPDHDPLVTFHFTVYDANTGTAKDYTLTKEEQGLYATLLASLNQRMYVAKERGNILGTVIAQ